MNYNDLANSGVFDQPMYIPGKPLNAVAKEYGCLLYTSPSPRDEQSSRMPSSA